MVRYWRDLATLDALTGIDWDGFNNRGVMCTAATGRACGTAVRGRVGGCWRSWDGAERLHRPYSSAIGQRVQPVRLLVVDAQLIVAVSSNSTRPIVDFYPRRAMASASKVVSLRKRRLASWDDLDGILFDARGACGGQAGYLDYA